VSNPFRGEVVIQVDGRERVLRPTFDAIVAWEQATSKTTRDLVRMYEEGAVMMGPIFEVILASTTDGLTRDELKAEIERRGFPWIFDPGFYLLLNSLRGGASEEGGGQGEAEATDQTTT
jgi:hypothetical protein